MERQRQRTREDPRHDEPEPKAPEPARVDVLALQRSAGNRATAAFLARSSEKARMPGLGEEKRKPEKEEEEESDDESSEEEAPQSDVAALVSFLDTLLPAKQVIPKRVDELTGRLVELSVLIPGLNDVELVGLCIVLDRLIYNAPNRLKIVTLLKDAKVLSPVAASTVTSASKGALATGFTMATSGGIQLLSLPDVIGGFKGYGCAQTCVRLREFGYLNMLRLLANETFFKQLNLKIKKERSQGSQEEFEDGELQIDLDLLKQMKAIVDAINEVNKSDAWVDKSPLKGKYDTKTIVALKITEHFNALEAFVKRHGVALAPMRVMGRPLLEWMSEQEEEQQCNNIFATGLGVRLDTLILGERGPQELEDLIAAAMEDIGWLEPEASLDSFPLDKKPK